MTDKDNQLQASGGVFMILGLVFSVVGASGQTTFLWIGIPFLITGCIQLVLARGSKNSESESRDDEPQSPDEA